MTLAVTARGTGATNTGGQTTLVVTPSGNLARNSVAVLCVAYDNSGTNGADPLSSVADSKGNTWSLDATGLNDPGAASAGIVGRIMSARLDAAGGLTTSDTITLTFGSTTVARAWVLWEVTAADGYWGQEWNEAAASQTSATPSITTASIASGDLVIAMVAREGNATRTDDADSTNGTWSTSQKTGVGSTTSGAEVISQYKVVTGTATQTYNPTFGGTSRDGVNAWVQKHEVALPTFTAVGAVTLPATSITGTGTETFTSTGSLTLVAAAVDGTGTAGASGVTGSGAITLPAASITGTGTETFTATGALTLKPASVSGTGTETFAATGAVTLKAASVSGTGTETFTATGALTLKAAAVSGTGTETFTSTGAITLKPASVSGTGAETFTATGSLVLQGVAVTGTGVQTIPATGSITLRSAAISGTGVQTLSGTGSLVLASVVVSGTGAETFTATGALTLSPFAMSGTGLGGVVASGAATGEGWASSVASGTGSWEPSPTGAAELVGAATSSGRADEAVTRPGTAGQRPATGRGSAR